MNDKTTYKQQVETLASDIYAILHDTMSRVLASALAGKGNRKLPEDSVVLNRDRYKRRITDLESENKKLMKLQARGGYRVAELGIENQQLKDRINELESENERLKGEKQKVLEYMKTDSFAKLKKEDMYWGYQMGIGMLEHEIDRQKDRMEQERAKNAHCLMQFAERLKENANIKNIVGEGWIVSYVEICNAIDETLKEFLGEKENDKA